MVDKQYLELCLFAYVKIYIEHVSDHISSLDSMGQHFGHEETENQSRGKAMLYWKVQKFGIKVF